MRLQVLFKIVFILVLISCKEKQNTISQEVKTKNNLKQEDENSFLSFIETIPEVKLPVESKNFEDFLEKQVTDADPELYLYKINHSKINKNFMLYDGVSYEFDKLKNTDVYKCENFINKIPNGNLHDYSLQKYLTEAKNYNDNVFFNIPIFRFNINDTYVIAFLTAVASENDASYADIRLHTYTKDGVLMLDKKSDTRDGISLIYSFSGELGIINIHSDISEEGIVNKETLFFDEEGKSKENNIYKITKNGFMSVEE